jgi:glycerophosphoryl diester phosphodiesterase
MAWMLADDDLNSQVAGRNRATEGEGGSGMRRMVLGLVFGLMSLAPAHASPIALPAVWAHRGGADLAPENTMAAFNNAAAIFAARGLPVLLEMDTQLTADGTLVIIHDDSLDRTTDCTGKVIQSSDAYIANCNAADDWPGHPVERVPTTREVLEKAMAGEWRVMIEIKDIPGEANFDALGTAAATKLVGLVTDLGFPHDSLIVQSFWPPALDAVRSLDPKIPTQLLTTSQLPGAPPGAGFTLIENAVFSALRGYEISAPDYKAIDMTAAGVAVAHALGRDVITWTVDSRGDFMTLAGYGVDGVITNDPYTLTQPVL